MGGRDRGIGTSHRPASLAAPQNPPFNISGQGTMAPLASIGWRAERPLDLKAVDGAHAGSSDIRDPFKKFAQGAVVSSVDDDHSQN
jgi:hypothetical protein